MKIACLLLIILASSGSDWRTEVDASIAALDAVTVPTREKISSEAGDTTIARIYQLGDLKKRSLMFQTHGFFGSGHFDYYSKNGVVFARKVSSTGESIRKGAARATDPVGSIGELNWYFRNENAGVSERRSIDYFADSNMDSLWLALQQQPFETDSIGHKEYLQANKSYSYKH